MKDNAFLMWLSGYFDHGACCFARNSPKKFEAAIYIHGEKDVLEEIRSIFAFEGASVVHRKEQCLEEQWDYAIRAIDEILSFSYQLLPYVRIRANELQHIITTIEEYVEMKLQKPYLRGREKIMVTKVLDIECLNQMGKFERK
jgi:hypothetical protein